MGLKLKAEYVSVEDFKTYTGIDLYEQLNDNTTPNFFLRDVEDELINYVNLQSWRPISRLMHENKFTPEQMDAWREAILIQAKYVFENGDILSNNGIDPEQGIRFGTMERYAASIAPNAINKLKMAGILTLVMRERG